MIKKIFTLLIVALLSAFTSNAAWYLVGKNYGWDPKNEAYAFTVDPTNSSIYTLDLRDKKYSEHDLSENFLITDGSDSWNNVYRSNNAKLKDNVPYYTSKSGSGNDIVVDGTIKNAKITLNVSQNYILAVSQPDLYDPSQSYYYFLNEGGWAEVAAYSWKGKEEPLGAWPGTKLPSVEINGRTLYYTPVDQSFTGLIFNNNNSGKQTSNITPSEDPKLTPNAVYEVVNGNTEIVAKIVNGKYVPVGEDGDPDPMPETKEGFNLLFFNPDGANFTRPCVYAFDASQQTNADWAAAPAAEGPINVRVKVSEDSDTYILTPVYYAYVEQKFDFVIFKGAGDVSGTGNQTKDLFIVPNGYYTMDTKSRTSPIYIISNSTTVYNHIPTPYPYTIFVTYNGISEGQDVKVVSCFGVNGGTYSGDGNIPMTYCEFGGNKYYKWTTASLYKSGSVNITFKYNGREATFSKDNEAPWGAIEIKDDLIINLSTAAQSILAPNPNLTVTLAGGIKARKDSSLTMTYDPESEDYIAIIGADKDASTPGVFYLTDSGVRYGVENPSKNGYQNGVWNNLVQGTNAVMEFSNKNRYYKMVYDPRGQILIADWITNASNIGIWTEGTQQTSTYSVDAVREEGTTQALKVYLKGSDAFNQAIDDTTQPFDVGNVTATLEPQFDSSVISNYMAPAELVIQHIEDDDSSVAGELILSCATIPVPGNYTLAVTYAGDDDFSASSSNITLEVRPTIESVGLQIISLDWSNPSDITMVNGDYQVSVKLNSGQGEGATGQEVTPTSLYFKSKYGYGAPYLQIYTTLSGWKTRSIDPELKEYTYPIPFDVVKDADSFNYQLMMNGAEGPKGTVSFAQKDIVTSVEGVETPESIEPEYFNLNGMRVEKENLIPGIYLVKKGFSTHKEMVK